jgi:putative ABC transport system ATP-binding protein
MSEIILRMENINKKYGQHIVFHDFNLNIREGEYVAIIGESGSGKTTLLNMIGMIDRPDSGNIYIMGKRNPHIDSKTGRILLRNTIAYVFQNYGLVEDETVKYNLKIKGYYSHKVKAVDMVEALYTVGLDESYMNKKVYELSGGEQQRVALAGTYLKDFLLILADEPTGSLDDKNKELVLDIFDKMNQEGKTIIVVTHDKEVKERARRTVVL